MKPIDYILIAAIVLIVAVIAVYIIRKKIKGENIGCGCGCQSCPHASACGAKATTEKNPQMEEKEDKTNDETV